MRKRTVITTEKHEVWVIRQAAEKPVAKDQTPDPAGVGPESIIPNSREEPDKPLTQRRRTDNDN